MMTRGPLYVFIAYEQEDTHFYADLTKRLLPIQREHTINISSHSTIEVGTEWEQEIILQIKRSSLILLLISPDFMASKRCYLVELKQAMDCHHAGTARVIPIILRPTNTTDAPFQSLRALPKNGQPLADQNIDEAFNSIIQELLTFIHNGSQLPPIAASQTRIPLPYERNLLFTGREELLERIHRSFQTGTTTALTQAISGLGGIGKTQTALEYAYRYEEEYETVLWVRAESAETMAADLTMIAEALQLPKRLEQEPAVVMRGFKRWLMEHKGWLLVLDNADNLEVIQDLPPTNAKGRTLITTRTPHVGRKARAIEIETMGLEEGALFLLRRADILEADTPLTNAGERERTAARELVKLVGGLPLALDQAGAYIEETQCGLEGYLRRFQIRQADLLNKRGEGIIDHPDPVATTWSLSFEKVQQASKAAADLLQVCAMLAPEEIPEEMIIKGAGELGPSLQIFSMDSLQLDEAIRVLRTYSFITRNPTTSMLTIHRLVQAVQKQAMSEEEQHVWAEHLIRVMNHAFSKITYETALKCQQYLPHALKCEEYIEHWDMSFPEAISLLNRVGYFLNQQANFSLAEPLYQRALTIREQVLGSEHPDTALSLNNLAELYRNLGKYELAESLHKSALAIYERVLGSEHPKTALSLNNLAALYYDLGKYEQVESLYQRALAIYDLVLNPKHPDTALSLNNLAELYRNLGKYELAEPLHQRALAIREQVLGSEHPSTAQSLNNLALLYHSQGKYEQIEQLYQRALAIWEQMLGSEHPNTAASLNNLAIFYCEQGKYEQAEPLYQRALIICEQVLGPEHLDTALSLNNLAALYYNLGKYEQAKLLLKRAVYIFDKVLGSHHPNTLTVKANYTGIVKKIKEIQQERE